MAKLVALGAILLVLGALVGAGRYWSSGLLALSPIVLLLFNRVLGLGTFIFIWSTLLASTLVWRSRTTSQLDANPLDRAALVRIALVGLAGLAALAVFARVRGAVKLPAALGFMGLYFVAAFVSALMSPLPLQALYRVFEFGVGLLCIAAAVALLGTKAGETMMRTSVGIMAAICALAWIEAIVVPARAWQPVSGRGVLFGHQLIGVVYPSFSANSVGFYGAAVAVWALAHTRSATGSGRLAHRVAFLGGLATLLATQYRTGSIGFVVAALVVLVFQHRWGALVFTAATLSALVVGLGWGTLSSRTTTAFERGNPTALKTLNGRTTYWHEATRLIRERPVLGWGLNVGSRKALVALGDQGVSTIHGTWPEATLGTGFVGASFVALAFLAVLRDSWRARNRLIGVATLGILIALLVRSFTGSTVELFGDGFLLFAAAAMAVRSVSEPDDLDGDAA